MVCELRRWCVIGEFGIESEGIMGMVCDGRARIVRYAD